MMGAPVGQQDRLFYEFSLDDMVPADHLLRRIDAVLDLSWVREELAPHYSALGRPSVCPELMLRMLLVGYCYSIRSERRLCQEVQLNLAYRWFCRLGLEDRVPDHSTFSVNRHGRFRDSGILRTVFEEAVCGCMKAGLVGGEGFAVDASVIEADASRFRRIEGVKVDWTAQQQASRPVREYLAALASENPPVNPNKPPKAMSVSDPCAAWTTRGRHKVMFAYSLNYLIDMDAAVILDVEATPTRITKEVDAAESMLHRTAARFALKPRHIAADVAYGTGELLGRLVAQKIDPFIPVWEQSGIGQKGKFTRTDFIYDKEADLYRCPGGKALRTSGTVHNGTTLQYSAKRSECGLCPLKPRCTSSQQRRLRRDINEEARDYVRGLMRSEDYEDAALKRNRIERLFADLKRNLGLTRLRLRGLTGALDEFLLAATVQNLRRLATMAPHPPPQPATA